MYLYGLDGPVIVHTKEEEEARTSNGFFHSPLALRDSLLKDAEKKEERHEKPAEEKPKRTYSRKKGK